MIAEQSTIWSRYITLSMQKMGYVSHVIQLNGWHAQLIDNDIFTIVSYYKLGWVHVSDWCTDRVNADRVTLGVWYPNCHDPESGDVCILSHIIVWLPQWE